jgi:hypothetical protein
LTYAVGQKGVLSKISWCSPLVHVAAALNRKHLEWTKKLGCVRWVGMGQKRPEWARCGK